MPRLDSEIADSDEIILNSLTCESELPDMGLRYVQWLLGTEDEEPTECGS